MCSIKIKKMLGDILVESQVINTEQLAEALEMQKQRGGRLGRLLVSLGYISEQMLTDYLEIQLDVPKIRLESTILNQEIVNLVPESLIRQHLIIPIKKEGNRLMVAMADPLNVIVCDDLQIATGCEIDPVLAAENEIKESLGKIFGLQTIIAKAVQEFEVQPSYSAAAFNLDDETDLLSEEAPTVKIVHSIIQQAVKERASDIHIEPRAADVRVRFRIDGVLRDIMLLPRQSLASVVSRIKIMADMDIAEKRVPLDGRIQIKLGQKSIDLRISTILTVFGEKVVIRILDKSTVAVNLDQLGFSNDTLRIYRKMVSHAYGMILITGPTGSGKTTTLYSTLSEINSAEKNIITIEDPVEYVFDNVNQIRVNQKAGLNFSSGLRAIMRQDPDVIMVGEIRDSETANIAVRAATTGHLVFTTLHTNDAAGALPRLVDMGVEPFLVASSVIGVMAQRLVRVICPSCKDSYLLPPYSSQRNFLQLPKDLSLTLYHGNGCARCGGTGYFGRSAIHELLEVNQEQRDLIITRASANEIKRSARVHGMVSLIQDGFQKALSGVTTLEEVMRVAGTDECFNS